MSKQWKIAAANAGLRLYTRIAGNFRPAASFDPQQSFERIVIFSTSALGDLMFNTPAIRALCERYPGAQITLVSSHKNRQLVEGSPCFHDVIYWDHKAKDMLAVIRRLRKTGHSWRSSCTRRRLTTCWSPSPPVANTCSKTFTATNRAAWSAG